MKSLEPGYSVVGSNGTLYLRPSRFHPSKTTAKQLAHSISFQLSTMANKERKVNLLIDMQQWKYGVNFSLPHVKAVTNLFRSLPWLIDQVVVVGFFKECILLLSCATNSVL